MWAVWLWMGCSSVPPELASQRAALDAYEEAVAAREAGRHDAALEHIDTAIAARPRDPLLKAWKADLLADEDPLAAAELLETVLVAHPGFGIARYNRGAYLARAGKLFEAGPELELALGAGVATAEQLRADPDLAPHLTHPALNFVPLPTLDVVAAPLPDKVFRDAEVSWTLRVGHTDELQISGSATGPLAWVSAVEDRRADDTEITFTFRALGQGTLSMGPAVVSGGGMTAEVPAATVDAVAPLGAEASPEADLPLWLPSVVGEGLDEGSVVRRNGQVWAKTSPVDRVAVKPAVPPTARLELRRKGQTEWVVWAYPATVSHVTVRGAGGVRHDGPPAEGGEAAAPR
jgi:hypothetical protein